MNRSNSLNLAEMLRQSAEVISRPGVSTFERYERSGGLTQAVVYVLLTSAVAGLLRLAFGGFAGWLDAVLGTLGGFLAFTLVVYYFGRTRGGTGTLDEVAYSFSLYWVPISVLVTVVTVVLSAVLAITIIGILLIPLVLLVAFLAYVFYAYLAVQASMNLRDPGSIALTLVLAAITSWVVQLLMYAI